MARAAGRGRGELSVLRAVFFDFADTLFSSRDLRDAHLAQLRAVADAVGMRPTDQELRAAYRQGIGVGYRAVASRPAMVATLPCPGVEHMSVTTSSTESKKT